MLSIHQPQVSRRELLRVGGLSLLGLSLPDLLHARESAPSNGSTFGRAKNVIFLYLAGGPPQHETFDPKPDAPAEIRGPFNPISTNVPGIQICELLPRIAHHADKLAIVRSMSTNDNTHSSSGAWVLTGYKYNGRNPRTIQPTDWPWFGSIIKRFKPSEKLPPLSTVWIPDLMRLNENVTPAGQTGGFMGREWDPERFVGDPSGERYEVEGLEMMDLPPLRLQQRQSLLHQVEQHFAAQSKARSVDLFNKYQKQAFDLLTTGVARRAFAIEQEPDRIRERYGRNRWGQCVLLARRLIEAGVRLVHVQWPREPGDNAVDNPLWDTHAQNAERMEDVLAPQFDVGFSALIEDLDQRGLLDETLVVAIGEFGRTPKINAKGGRDHWGPVFSFAMAGAGISGGQVYGASDKNGGYATRDRMEPGDLTATLFHLMGVNPHNTFLDREGRIHHFSRGKVLDKLLGDEPATVKRMKPTGDVRRVAPFDESQWLIANEFEPPVPLMDAKMGSRPRGWRASPLLKADEGGFGVRLQEGQIAVGHHGKSKVKIAKGTSAVLAQEVRSPFAGTFEVEIQVKANASDRALLEKHFTCRLMFFQYLAKDKNANQRKELASLTFKPQMDAIRNVKLSKQFLNPKAGANFSFGLGLGVAVIVEKTSAGDVELGVDQVAQILIDRIDVRFAGKPRIDSVVK